MELGYKRREFGRLSMAEFAALMRAWNRKQEREERRFAAMQAIYAECHRDSSKRPHPFHFNDFMPAAYKRDLKPQRPADIEASNKQAISLLRGITEAIAERNTGKLDTSGGTP